MNYLAPTLVLYFLIGLGVAAAVYLTVPTCRWLSVLVAWPFWPIYLPILLASSRPAPTERPWPNEEVLAAIAQVNAELEAALASLDGWAEDVLAREKGRIHELRVAWSAQAERIREMDHLLSLPEYAEPAAELPGLANERVRQSREARQQNIERLREVRRRAYDDLMGSLAWVRELVSMIHLAKFTGAPAARAEELVAQIAAAVEGLSEVTWKEELGTPLSQGGNLTKKQA